MSESQEEAKRCVAMMNGMSGGFKSHKKHKRQTERLVPMTHLAGERQKWLLVYTNEIGVRG